MRVGKGEGNLRENLAMFLRLFDLEVASFFESLIGLELLHPGFYERLIQSFNVKS